MSEVLKHEKVMTDPYAIPVPVLVAATAIIMTRCLGIALEVHEMGLAELVNFVQLTAQSWRDTLIFIAGQLLFFIQLRCAFALLHGRHWGRTGYALSQLVVVSYMLLVHAGWLDSALFTNVKEGQLLIMQKLPDLLVLMLLFVPACSRDFFRQR
ncbi:YbjO family protein [Erwinia sp. BNK-24-b]|uniref:YbjO family protein n=1 Tax=Erwinia TaxID=551 RepID=UPI001FEE85AB|nr:YbjO family protein [Erwinia phyllosphaerae]MBV4367753.1 YbjO family protein [Erwinia phyllosphaerae]